MKLVNGQWRFTLGEIFEYERNMDTPAARAIRADLAKKGPGQWRRENPPTEAEPAP